MRFWLLLVLLMAGCTDGPAVRLRAAYPEHAAAILAAAEGLDQPRANGMRAAFGAKGVVRFELADGFAVTVRERGVGAGGATFWTGTERGYEEWLLVDPPVDAETPVAEWEVEGAGLRRRGPDVEVVDAHGVARLVVRAPVGFSGHSTTTPALRISGARIALHAPVALRRGPMLLDPSWQPAASMAVARTRHAAALLQDGRVLVVGGSEAIAASSAPLTSAEAYDPATDAWLDAGQMVLGRGVPSATVLASGLVLVGFGGTDGAQWANDVELFNPVSNLWVPSGWADAGLVTGYPFVSGYHTATRLTDGRVLLVPGTYDAAYIYDPVAQSWTLATPPAASHLMGRSMLLPDGRVFVSGTNTTLGPSEVYDPGSGLWSPAPPSCPRLLPSLGLLNGQLLIAGGNGGPDPCATTTQLYDPLTNTLADAGRMSHPHYQAASCVTKGRMFVLGGFDDQITSTRATDVFEFATGLWTAGPPMGSPRAFHTATLLPTGMVLIAGGGVDGGETSELYDPTFGMPCLGGTDCLSATCVDGVCCESTCAGACEVCNAPGRQGFCMALDAGAGGTPSCTPYLCGGGSGCSSACTLDTECATGNFCGAGACLAKAALGVGCGASNACLSGNCVDGVCCDTTCGNGNPGDCQACSVDAGAPVNGTCALLPPTKVCRAQNGGCDEADHCPGNDAGCPLDLPLPAGTVCRAAAGFCDLPEVCNGIFGECPADALVDAGIACRLSAGTCDPAEVCSGLTPDCPPDVLVDAGVICRPVLAVCDAEERCLGDKPACPTDRPAPDGTACIKGGTCGSGTCVPPSGTGTGGGSGGQGGGGSAVVDAGPGPAPTAGCGCSSEPGAIWLAIALVPALRRRRRGPASTAAGPRAPLP